MQQPDQRLKSGGQPAEPARTEFGQVARNHRGRDSVGHLADGPAKTTVYVPLPVTGSNSILYAPVSVTKAPWE
jgi:hypothetical protein